MQKSAGENDSKKETTLCFWLSALLGILDQGVTVCYYLSLNINHNRQIKIKLCNGKIIVRQSNKKDQCKGYKLNNVYTSNK